MNPFLKDELGKIRFVSVVGKNTNRYRGKYPVFYLEEEHPQLSNYLDCTIGNYIADKNGVILQILDTFTRGLVKFVILPVGATCIVKNGVPIDVDFLNKQRPNWVLTKNGTSSKYFGFRRLSANDEKILRRLFENNFDYLEAYKFANGNTPLRNIWQKYNIHSRVKRILINPYAEKIMSKLVYDVMKESGLSAKEWFARLVNSVPQKLKSQTDLVMWEKVANSIPELRKLLAGEEEDKTGLLGMGEEKEAEFVELKEHTESNDEIQPVIQRTTDGRPRVTV